MFDHPTPAELLADKALDVGLASSYFSHLSLSFLVVQLCIHHLLGFQTLALKDLLGDALVEKQDVVGDSYEERVELEHQCEEIGVLQKESGLDGNVMTRNCSQESNK